MILDMSQWLCLTLLSLFVCRLTLAKHNLKTRMQLRAKKETNEIWNICPANQSVCFGVMPATHNMNRPPCGLTHLTLLQPISLINNQARIQTRRGILPELVRGTQWCIKYSTASNFLLGAFKTGVIGRSPPSAPRQNWIRLPRTNQVLLWQKS